MCTTKNWKCEEEFFVISLARFDRFDVVPMTSLSEHSAICIRYDNYCMIVHIDGWYLVVLVLLVPVPVPGTACSYFRLIYLLYSRVAPKINDPGYRVLLEYY